VTPPCQLLPWDSEFFGRRIARLTVSRWDAPLADAVERWCTDERIDLLYFLADASHHPTLRLAEERGCRLMDVRVELDAQLPEALRQAMAPPPSQDVRIRLARPEDLDGLRGIAAVSHVDSRFFADPGIPAASARALYVRWIERSVEGVLADWVLVGERGRQILGYLTGRRITDAGGAGEIGLLGVDASARGAGAGRMLLGAGMTRFADVGVTSVTVVTQGRNVEAQRLYQQGGFRTRSLNLWYHKWFRT